MDAAKRLKELRTSKNITTTELAKMCNISQDVISKLENNNRIVDVPTLSLICSALGITLKDFFDVDQDIPVAIQQL
ncbi:MAG: helix-turn-helix transcriptional regulator, partial [Cellulosilyticaceae bacterium]